MFFKELHRIWTGVLANRMVEGEKIVYTCGRELTGSGMMFHVIMNIDISVKYQTLLHNM